MLSYKHILLQQVSLLSKTNSLLTKLTRKIIIKKTFEGVLRRTIMSNVSIVLRITQSFYYLNHDSDDIIEIGKEDLVRRETTKEDDQYYAN